MKRLILVVLAVIMVFGANVGFADGNSYQQNEQYAQVYYVLSNNTQIYRDENCKSAVGTLNFGDKVYLQVQYETVSYVMCESNRTFAYVRNSQIGQPLKKVRLTQYVYLSPTKDEWFDNLYVYGTAIGGYRIKEDAFVLCEMSNHYLLLTDEGYMGWVSKSNSGIKEVESYRAVNTLNTEYYWRHTQNPYNPYEGQYYTVLRPSLKLYKSSSASSSSSKKIGFGARVEILATDGEWCQVVDSTGNSGWLRKAFLENPEMKIRINGKVRLNPLPGMQDTDYAIAAGGVVKTGDAYVLTVIGDYYLIVTANGNCGFVHKDNQNIQVLQTYPSYNYYEVDEEWYDEGDSEYYYDGGYWDGYDGDG